MARPESVERRSSCVPCNTEVHSCLYNSWPVRQRLLVRKVQLFSQCGQGHSRQNGLGGTGSENSRIRKDSTEDNTATESEDSESVNGPPGSGSSAPACTGLSSSGLQIIPKEYHMKSWREATHEKFPHLFTSTFIIPPIYFNRVQYLETTVGSEITVGSDVIKSPQHDLMSDVRSDEALRRIHNALTSMFERKRKADEDEGMVVIFSLLFDHYLNCGGKTNTFPLKKRPGHPYRRRGCGKERKSSEWSAMTSGGKPNDPTVPSEKTASSLPHVDLSIFPRPRDLQQRGEFDILMLHRTHGIIIVEVKSVGNVTGVSVSQSEQEHVIRKRVRQSLKQLDRQVGVLRHVVGDVTQGWVPITKVLMLPNLQRRAVRAALEQDPALYQLPPIGHSGNVDDDVIRDLCADWWLPLTSAITSNYMNDQMYESLFARFCGPATKLYVHTAHNPRAEVSTLSEAVLHTSRCFTGHILPERQVMMLKDPSPRVFLSGPPGTGKSLMLTLKTKEWLRQGHTVMIISLWTASHAASLQMCSQVEREVTTEQAGRLLHVLNRKPDFENIITEIQQFKCHTPKTMQLFFSETPVQENPSQDSGFNEITDSDLEGDDSNCTQGGHGREGFRALEPRDGRQHCHTTDPTQPHDQPGPKHSTDAHQKLFVVVNEAPWFLDYLMLILEGVLGKDGFVIWVATSLPCPPPSTFACYEVTQNVRRPPAVVRQMTTTPAYRTFSRVKYTSEENGVLSSVPFPTDGPRVKRIQHDDHSSVDTWDCEQCGMAVAAFLTHNLKIYDGAGESSTLLEASENTLHFSDVLISGYLPNLVTTSTWETSLPAARKAGFLKGLESKGIKFDVIEKDDVGGYQRLAVPPCTDRVQVAEADMIKGLERAVVVVLGTQGLPLAVPRYVDPLFDVMGCCTSQLVIAGDDENSFTEWCKKMSILGI
ncbi:uncharacterized protein LOC143291678 isoform X2 [Babylonia areolata]|uniref:uncharacterized protein LOC143291678 isoform X2 n=1 Tax=Babylonia areolata TaxID=304850 RepID=UPI003FCFD47F